VATRIELYTCEPGVSDDGLSVNKIEPVAFLGPWRPWGRRLPMLATLAGAAVLAVWVDQASEPRSWIVAIASLGLGLFAARRTSRVGSALAWGAAMVLASLGAQGEHRGLDAAGAIGAMACAMAASVGLAGIPAGGGIVRTSPGSPVLPVLVVAVAWWTALVARLSPPDGPLAWMTEYPRAWGLGAAAVSTLVLIAESEWMLHRRRLELGIVQRLTAVRALLAVCLGTAFLIGALGHAQPDALGRLVVVVASGIVGGAAIHPDAVRVARASRRAVVLTLAGGGAALLGASAVGGPGSDAWAATLATAVVALAIGSVAPSLEAPLRPARGVRLDAFARACAESSRAEPEDVIREMLVALRGSGGLSSASPELWTTAPARVTTVDRAGYLHERDADLPEALALTALGEPERTLRADVLEAFEVRRPELRALSGWMVDRGALLATVIAYGGDVEGVLLIPRAARDEPPTLEEVRALRDVADCMAAACRARATQARMLARTQAARDLADRAEEQVERTRHERALDVGRNVLAATRLARPATVGGYSAASRMALEALERRTSIGAPIAVVAPSGVDPVPYLARAHLAGARGKAPLVLVDATSAREHDLSRWCNPEASPLALADRGTLVLLDGAALPMDVQQLVARVLAEKRAPWERAEPLDVQLALTAVLTPEDLTTQMRLDPSLGLRLGDAFGSPVALPRLRDRVEDLRAVLTDRLAREGLRVLGRSVGIEQAAYARLIEYPFPGEDAELAAIVQRLVTRCAGEVVRASDVNALRLGGRRGASGSQASGASGARRKSPMSA
jgi:hypothetical protein